MKSTFLSVVSSFLFFSSLNADALILPFSRRATTTGVSLTSTFSSSRYTFAITNSSEAESVSDVQDMRYITNITINGVPVTVALDTGSTDLWVIPPGGIGTFNDTGIALQLLYGDGSYGTTGTIGVSPFEFGSYKIDKQAFMNADQSSIGGLQELGVYGLMGLSFDFTTASPINDKIKSIYGPDATWGQSVLRNIFQQNPSEPNFIAIHLSRSGDLEDTDGGSLTIGEYESKYAAVANKTQLPQHPTGGDRWTTLLEGVYVDGSSINVVSTIDGVPAGQAQTLLDTGDPNGIFPVAMYDAIYSKIPGSALLDDGTDRMWIIPCNTTTHVEVAFGGERYPIHPLDLSTISDPFTVNGNSYIACVAAFKGADRWGGDGYDVSLGDSFLRNVYSVFDFGDTMPDGTTGAPYMKLLSTLDPAQAITEVSTIRGSTMLNLPPEMDPQTLVSLLNGGNSAPTQTDGVVSPTTSGFDTPGATTTSGSGDLSSTNGNPKDFGVNVAPSGPDNATTITIDDSTVKKYGLIIIILLGANIIIGLVLIVLGLLACVRRGSSSRKSRNVGPPAYAPVKSMDRDEGYSDMPKLGYTQ